MIHENWSFNTGILPQPLDEVLDFLDTWNIQYCEIINEYPYDELDEDILGSYQVHLTVHAPLSDINLASHNQAIRKSSVAEVKKSLDRAVKWNAEYWWFIQGACQSWAVR